MAYIEIPLRNDVYFYSEKILLEGILYTFEFRFNSRQSVWYMDIGDAAGIKKIIGIPMFINFPLTNNYIGIIEGVPPGQILLIDETNQNKLPTRDNMGIDMKLIYVEAG